jgi:hypothetical protein
MNSMFVRLDLPSSNLRCLGWGPLVHCRTLWCLWFSRGTNHSLLLVGVLTMLEFSSPCHWVVSNRYPVSFLAFFNFIRWIVTWNFCMLQMPPTGGGGYRYPIGREMLDPGMHSVGGCDAISIWDRSDANKRWWCVTACSNWGTSHCSC